jgi:hypothetical protein
VSRQGEIATSGDTQGGRGDAAWQRLPIYLAPPVKPWRPNIRLTVCPVIVGFEERVKASRLPRDQASSGELPRIRDRHHDLYELYRARGRSQGHKESSNLIGRRS